MNAVLFKLRLRLLVGLVLALAVPFLAQATDVNVTGSTAGSVWGSGPYTGDSDIGTAAVHAGLISVGQHATIRVTSLGTQSSFPGSSANGVTTSSWFSPYEAVSLEFVSSQGGSNHPASVTHNAPSWVYVGDSFTVTASCSDADGNLSGMCVRWQGVGVVGYWNESGSSGSESITLAAPSTSGSINIRAEAIDTLGEGGDSGWQTIEIRDYPPPSAPTNHPPSTSLSFSANSLPTNGTLRVTQAASDPDSDASSIGVRDLNSMGVRWQNVGLAAWWSISGVSASRFVDLPMAPPAGTQYFRGEVWDNALAGVAADWQAVVTVAPSAPSVAVTPVNPRQGQTITVSYVDAPDSTTWIGLFRSGTNNSSELASVTVPHAGSDSVPITLGTTFQVGQTYEARMFPSGGRTDAATSNTFTISAVNPTYVISVVGGTGGSAAAHTGDVLTLTATPQAGQTFVNWSMYGAGNGTIVSASSSTTQFIVGTSDATVQAVYTLPPNYYLLTVIGGNALPAGPQPAGTAINLTPVPPAGQSFSGWTLNSGVGTLNNANLSTASFTLGAGIATVEAHYTSSDLQAPTQPRNPVAFNVTTTSAVLAWTASADNVGVTGYQIFKNGTALSGLVTGTSTTITGLVGGTSYQFYIVACDAAGNSSAASSTVTVVTPTVPAIRLGLEYWQANDYPNWQPTHQIQVWVDGYWWWSEHPDWDAYATWDGTTFFHVYDPDGNDTGYIFATYAVVEWHWEEAHMEMQTVVDGPPQPGGQYGSSWTSSAGGFNINTVASGYDVSNANRGNVTNSYVTGNLITFRAWGSAPANNCNSYQGRVYAPNGTLQQSGNFGSGSYWQCQFTPSTSGVYRIEISYSNATGGADPASATVSYFVPVGSLSVQTINFPPISDHYTTDSTFGLTATATSGLPITYTVVSGPATVSNTTITLTGAAGTVLVRASQNGNASYGVATPVDRTFGVAVALPPAAPNSVVASNGLSDKVHIAWNAAVGVGPISYDVYRNTSNDPATATKLTGTTVTDLFYDDTTGTIAVPYYYWVKAKGAGGYSPFSISAAGLRTFAVPATLPATGVTATGFTANWSPVSGASYLLDVSTSVTFAAFVLNGQAVASGTSYPVTGLAANTTYYYRIRAVIGNAASPNSDVRAVTTLPVIIAQPQNATAVLVAGQTTPVAFTVAVSGLAPLTYQWRKDGANISGATGRSYIPSNVQLSDAGSSYTVVVTNASGSVISNAATLAVQSGVTDTSNQTQLNIHLPLSP